MATKSTFIEKAKFRQQNKRWLRYSRKIASRILSAMEDNESMTRQELADKVGVTSQYISKVVSGKENLSLETIAKFSEALDVELISFPAFKDDIRPVETFSYTKLLTDIKTSSLLGCAYREIHFEPTNPTLVAHWVVEEESRKLPRARSWNTDIFDVSVKMHDDWKAIPVSGVVSGKKSTLV